jgi:hypothetical protein
MSTIVWNKRLRKQKGQSRMDNLETLETPTSEEKKKNTSRKLIKMSNKDPMKLKKGC